MKNIQKGLLGLLLIGGISVTALVSANDNNWMGIGVGLHADVDDEHNRVMLNQKADLELRKDQKTSIRIDGQARNHEYGFLGGFFKADLSDAEKVAIKARIEKFQTDREVLFKAMIEDKKADGKIDTEIYVKAFSDLRAKYYADLRIYVDPDKRDKYDAFVAARNAAVIKNISLREEARVGNKDFSDKDKDKPKESEKKVHKDNSFNNFKARLSLFSDTALIKLKAYIDVLLGL